MMQPILFLLQGSSALGGVPAPFLPVQRTGFVDPVLVLPRLRQPILFPLMGLSHGIRNGGIPALMAGRVPAAATKLLISGVTRDSQGVVLGSCTVTLYRTSDDVMMEKTTSDASTGAYSFSAVGLSESYYVVAYKTGSPDVEGTTVNTLVGT